MTIFAAEIVSAGHVGRDDDAEADAEIETEGGAPSIEPTRATVARSGHDSDARVKVNAALGRLVVRPAREGELERADN